MKVLIMYTVFLFLTFIFNIFILCYRWTSHESDIDNCYFIRKTKIIYLLCCRIIKYEDVIIFYIPDFRTRFPLKSPWEKWIMGNLSFNSFSATNEFRVFPCSFKMSQKKQWSFKTSLETMNRHWLYIYVRFRSQTSVAMKYIAYNQYL